MLGLGAGVRVIWFCLREINIITQYVVRIEMLVRGFCLEGILSGWDSVRGDYVRKGFHPGCRSRKSNSCVSV